MSIDDLSLTTRVFVSGLPPSLTTKDLRTCFGQKFNVTDAHVLPGRCIGFVGLTDHDSAERAAKYFNKSFIRMSKISVELAKPVDLQISNPGQATPAVLATVQEANTDSNKTSKTQKRKRDSQDDGERLRGRSQLPENANHVISPQPQAAQVDSEVVPVSKDASAENPAVGDDPTPASDQDWLRGRTSRVLDLEEPPPERVTTHPEIQVLAESVHDEAEDPPKNAAENAADAIGKSDNDQTQISNGRLFLRNLAFGVSEHDLREMLQPFGNLEEVRLSLHARFH